MRTIFISLGKTALMLFFFSASLAAQDPLLHILSSELEREFRILGQEDTPPYQIEYRLNDRTHISMTGMLGSLTESDSSRNRNLYTSVRVGDYAFDNSHPGENEAGWMGMSSSGSVPATPLPLENNPLAIRQHLWRVTDMAYKSALSSYLNLVSNKGPMDSIPDFSREKSQRHEEAPLPSAWNSGKRLHWEKELKRLSASFLSDNSIIDGSAHLDFIDERKYFVSSEGSRIVQNHRRAQLVLSASIIAKDGSRIPLEKIYHAREPDQLPGGDSLLAACSLILDELKALARAPQAEPYSGPAILSAAATGVFFHEIFGHRIEGHRLKNKSDGQTFRERMGEQVLHKNLSVISDPTVRDFQGQRLNGHYAYDDQGVPAERVLVVEKGILRSFLMSRRPLKKGGHSNGHGRADAGMEPVSRQSNLFITTEKGRSDAQLRKDLVKMCKKQGLDFGYFISEVAGGFTTTDRYRPNVFNIEPRKVYKVYTDGRPDELVRGVSLIGTPLTMFSGIEEAGNEAGVFNGICGAESGGVPVSTVAPALLVAKIETQRIPEGNWEKAILPIPGGEGSLHQSPPAGEIVLKAMEDELERNLEQLKYKDYEKPFFISYSLSDHAEFRATASLGSLMQAKHSRYSTSNVRLMVGTYELNDENYQDQGAHRSGQRGYIQAPLEEDYWGLRRSFWIMTDQVYKSAGSLYKNKLDALQSRKLPATYQALPDFSREEVVQVRQEREEAIPDTMALQKQVRSLSAIMRDFPEIISSQVGVELRQSTIYFASSEGSRIRYPQDQLTLMVQLECMGSDAQSSYRFLSYTGNTISDLPGESQLRTDIRSTIDSLIHLSTSPTQEEAYFGPVLFTGQAAGQTMSSLLLQALPSLVAFRPPLTKDAQGNLYINGMWGAGRTNTGQRMMAEQVSLRALNQLESYQGTALTGNYPVDAEGVLPPDTLLLVNKGILVQQISKRTPTKEHSHSTGHTRASPYAGNIQLPGILDMEAREGLEKEALLATLKELALDARLDHAFVLHSVVGGGIPIPFLLYRLDLESGDMELIRILSPVELPENSLRNIRHYSKGRMVYHHVPSAAFNPGMGGGAGLPMSLILPDAFIVEDVRMTPLFSPLSVAPPIVPNPLEKE